ncbi:hypothetical protein SAMN06296273_0148 [Nitrosomonas ureae]|uniref:Uncharacterized protein n=1 Tax=Nitrosomonas ureae TaxID=44577 RepID=A0A285BUR3_9PROT|nr:hypothetical protein SAMN06296273_0148 [Nitrosomonas ureae]
MMMQRLNSSQELAYLEKPEKIEISKEEIKQKIYLPKGYRLQVTGYRLQVTGYRLQVTGYRLQVTVYRL